MASRSLELLLRLAAGLTLAAIAAACSTPEPPDSIETTTPAPFRPGDPTATPLGEEIDDPDYLTGKTAYWAGDDEAVLPRMEAVVERHPGLAPPHWYRGMALWRLEDCESGLAEMELALELEPGYALAWADRGLMHACLTNEADALADYQRALSLDPSLAKVHERLGAYAFNQGDYEGAVEEHTLAVEIDPTRTGAWVGRAQALQFLMRFEDCIESATEALRVDPEHWPAYSARGVCAFEMGEYERGVADYERYVAEVPEDADAWYNLGIGYRRSGQIDNAIEACSRVLSIDPIYVEAFINRGSTLIDLGRFEDSLADYDKALALGEIPAAYNGRGDAYVGLGRFEEARADFERSIELMPYSTFAYCRLVNVYFHLERYRDTIWAAQEAARVAPECATDQTLLELQARSYYSLGLYDQAIEYMDRALEQGTYGMAFYYRGIAHDDAGNWREATMDLESFVDVATIQDFGDKEREDAEARLARLRTTSLTPGPTPGVLAQATSIPPDGVGPITLEAGESVTFKIVHMPPVTIEIAGNAFLYFVGVTSEGSDDVDFVFTIWDQGYGEWNDNQGHNQISEGSSAVGLINAMAIVDVHGELVIEIRNRGSSPVTVEKFQMTMLVETTDGRTLELGSMPSEP